MRLLTARVVGFQSFADSGELKFGPGINLLVGQNNAGKSAFLRGLQPDLADDRHRTPTGWLDAGLPCPYSDFVFELTGDELRMATLERNQHTIYLCLGIILEERSLTLSSFWNDPISEWQSGGEHGRVSPRPTHLTETLCTAVTVPRSVPASTRLMVP